MRQSWKLGIGAVALSVTVFAGTASAITGTVTTDTVNYKYSNVSGGDSSTCGPDWANDKQTRTFKVYKEQSRTGAYQVTETFTGGAFTTVAASSPESCEAGTTNTVKAGVKGTFHGSETLIVSNTNKSGNWNPATDVACSATCTTSEWINHAFGASATFDTAGDWWFSYRTMNRDACASHWINAAYGNSGDIATICP